MNGISRWVVAALAAVVLAAWAPVVVAADGYTPPAAVAQAIVLTTMVLQWVGSFFAAKTFGVTARKFIPLLNFIVATLSQLSAAFSQGLGPQPVAALGDAVIMAGFFGTFGKGLLDILANSLIQALIITGAHSGPKNVREGIALAAAARASSGGR